MRDINLDLENKQSVKINLDLENKRSVENNVGNNFLEVNFAIAAISTPIRDYHPNIIHLLACLLACLISLARLNRGRIFK